MLRMATLSILLAICAWSIVGCGGPSNEEIAVETAQQWVDSSIGQVSEAVVELVAGEYPAVAGIASAVVADQLRDNLEWEYSTPRRESGERYSLTATATADIQVQVPLLGSQEYSASMPFNLVVDTKERTVVSWSPNLVGASIERQ